MVRIAPRYRYRFGSLMGSIPRFNPLDDGFQRNPLTGIKLRQTLTKPFLSQGFESTILCAIV